MFKGVIFDLFHTLTARESQWSDLPTTSAVLGIDRRLWDELLMERSRWRLAGEERDPYAIISTLALQADPTIPDDRIREAVRVRIQRFRDTLIHVPPENIATLRTLQSGGFRLGLVSNADVIEIAAWDQSPLAALFDAAIFSCAAGCVKPERAIYEHCLEALGLRGRECLYVGDGGSNEFAGARSVGMSTVFVSGVMSELWPEHVPHRMAASDYHIERIPEVLPLVALPMLPLDEDV